MLHGTLEPGPQLSSHCTPPPQPQNGAVITPAKDRVPLTGVPGLLLTSASDVITLTPSLPFTVHCGS